VARYWACGVAWRTTFFGTMLTSMLLCTMCQSGSLARKSGSELCRLGPRLYWTRACCLSAFTLVFFVAALESLRVWSISKGESYAPLLRKKHGTKKCWFDFRYFDCKMHIWPTAVINLPVTWQWCLVFLLFSVKLLLIIGTWNTDSGSIVFSLLFRHQVLHFDIHWEKWTNSLLLSLHVNKERFCITFLPEQHNSL